MAKTAREHAHDCAIAILELHVIDHNDTMAYAQVIDVLTDMVSRAQVIDGLPRTADGVVVTPGDTVWYIEQGTTKRPACPFTVRRVSNDMVFDGSGGQPHFIRDKSVSFWSTEKLALTERADRLRADASEAEAAVDAVAE